MSNKRTVSSTLIAALSILTFSTIASAQTILSSSWEHSTGTTDAAVTDNGNWDSVYQNGVLSVVRAENGVTPVHGNNMYRVDLRGETNANLTKSFAFDLTSNNQYIRFYVNVQCINASIGEVHYVQDFDDHLGLADSRNFYWKLFDYNHTTGRYRMGWSTYEQQQSAAGGCMGNGDYLGMPNEGPTVRSWGRIGAPSPNIESNNDPNGLQCGQWYRVEIHLECLDNGCFNQNRNSPARMRVHQRVYDSSGTQILGNGQFRSMAANGAWQGGTSGVSIEDAYTNSGSGNDLHTCFYMTSGRPSFYIANNGQQGAPSAPGAFMYFDAAATSSSGWIGAVSGGNSGGDTTAPAPPTDLNIE